MNDFLSEIFAIVLAISVVILITQFHILRFVRRIKQSRSEVVCKFEHVKLYSSFDVIQQNSSNVFDTLIDNSKYLPNDIQVVASSWTVTPPGLVQVHYTDFLWGEGITSLQVEKVSAPTDIVVQYDVCFKTSDCTRLKMISVVNNFTVMPTIETSTRG